jgi:CubicO group peptidase (beta-lactamase class C family)
VYPFASFREVCRGAIADGTTPGLVAVVAAGGRTLLHEAFGLGQLVPAKAPATVDTVYDLASLTKALVTSVLAMQAVANGRLRLEDPAPGQPSGGATVRLMLAHAAGLPAHRRYFDQLGVDLTRTGPAAPELRDRVVAMAAAEAQVYPPGSRSLYSDVGFILLGDLLERVLGGRLDALADEHIFRPLAIDGLGFLGASGPSPTAPGGRPVAPTELCPVRGRLLVGEAHDLNAHVMGGVAGHAGLFGTAAAVATLAHALCAAWRDAGPSGGSPLVAAPVLRAFWTAAGIPDSCWRLGWDGPSPSGSLAGDVISRDGVGHLGFTGCSLWIDPARETFVLVLSNRIHPTRHDDARFRALRPALNDAALDDAGY